MKKRRTGAVAVRTDGNGDVDEIPAVLEATTAVLWQSILDLRAGRTTVARVNATSKAAGKVISNVRAAMKAGRLTSRTQPSR